MATNNGAWYNYANVSPRATFFRNSRRATKSVTVKSGQVLKAMSFLETGTDGKAIAHSGINEKALVTFADITNAQTVILAGLTFTAGASGATKEELVTAWTGLQAGVTAAAATTQNPVTGGTFTAGTLTGWNVDASATADSVLFVSTTPFAGVTDLADSGTATDPTIAITAVVDPINKVAGVLLYDVDASAADVVAEAYVEASFWADALVWDADITTDTITLYDGTTKAVTAYNTGATSDILKQKFVENTPFHELGFKKAGEVY